MVPVEWPIAAPAEDGRPVPARVAGGRRLSTVRADFFLDPRSRLTEQERALMTAMLADLVSTAADEFALGLGNAEPANHDGERLLDRLWRAGLLDIPELVALLLRRAEEERVSAGIRAMRPAAKPRFLQSLVSDEESAISAAAMALILARSRRRDRFDGPRLAFDDLSAECAAALANSIAAALRDEVTKRLDRADSDDRLTAAVQALLSAHDEGNRVEARLFELVHALDRAGRLDERLILSFFHEGDIALVTEVLARRSGIGFDSAWEHVTSGDGRLALLLRMAGASRDLAGEIIAGAAEIVGSDAESEIQTFDQLQDETVERARNWLRLDPSYRSAIDRLGGDDGDRAL